MKTCSNCFRVNDDAAEYCHECGAKFTVWKGAEPLPLSKHHSAKSGAIFSALSSMSTMSLTCLIAIIHFIASCVIGFVGFASAFGSGLSDSYNAPSQTPNALLILLEAPVALIQWAAIKCHPKTNTGLNLPTLLLIACLWSVVFGWASATLFKKFGSRKD